MNSSKPIEWRRLAAQVIAIDFSILLALLSTVPVHAEDFRERELRAVEFRDLARQRTSNYSTCADLEYSCIYGGQLKARLLLELH